MQVIKTFESSKETLDEFLKRETLELISQSPINVGKSCKVVSITPDTYKPIWTGAGTTNGDKRWVIETAVVVFEVDTKIITQL